jgi:opacity protein-like surface antigen
MGPSSQAFAKLKPLAPPSFLTATGAGSTVSMSSDDIETGYTFGGGLDWAFAPNWSLKTEHLYINLGDQTLSSSGPAGTFTSHMWISTPRAPA